MDWSERIGQTLRASEDLLSDGGSAAPGEAVAALGLSPEAVSGSANPPSSETAPSSSIESFCIRKLLEQDLVIARLKERIDELAVVETVDPDGKAATAQAVNASTELKLNAFKLEVGKHLATLTEQLETKNSGSAQCNAVAVATLADEFRIHRAEYRRDVDSINVQLSELRAKMIKLEGELAATSSRVSTASLAVEDAVNATRAHDSTHRNNDRRFDRVGTERSSVLSIY